MLKAKLDSVRKNKKGFSLVELIIVIAIMVALIAVMAPAFVKYVQKSRDAALATAAEDYEKTVQTYYGDPDAALPAAGTYTITLSVAGGKLNIQAGGATDANFDINKLNEAAGADTTKKMGATNDKYIISVVVGADSNLKVTMVKS